MRLAMFVVMFVVIFEGLAGSAIAQGTTAAAPVADSAPPPWYSLFTDNRSERFSKLRVRRVELNREIDALQTDIKDLRLKNETLDENMRALDRQISELSQSEVDTNTSLDDLLAKKARAEFDKKQKIDEFNLRLDGAKRSLEELKALSPPLTAAQEDDLQFYTARIASADGELALLTQELDFNISELQKQIEALQKRNETENAERVAEMQSLSEKRTALQAEQTANTAAIAAKTLKITADYSEIDTIDAEILKLIDVGDTDGWFKIIISLSFALLVAGVIYGFYRVISGNVTIVTEIFSNDSGIQFVTIFSIVIAVILFGIIGVLEGKELSALLGGLSGYILGRNSASKTVVTTPPADGAKPADPAKPVDPAKPADGVQPEPAAEPEVAAEPPPEKNGVVPQPA